jgi:hypothetical protein
MTARQLLGALLAAGCRLTVRGSRLAVAGEVPLDLQPALIILHTGVRAQLDGAAWCGCRGRTGHISVLRPEEPIPADVTLLCCSGDRSWDRLPDGAKDIHPALFARPDPSVGRPPSRGRRSA